MVPEWFYKIHENVIIVIPTIYLGKDILYPIKIRYITSVKAVGSNNVQEELNKKF